MSSDSPKPVQHEGFHWPPLRIEDPNALSKRTIITLFVLGILGTSFWTGFFAYHQDHDMTVMYGSLANICTVLLSGYLLFQEKKLKNPLLTTIFIAMTLLSIQGPFLLHYYLNWNWVNARVFWVLSPFLLSLCVARPLLDLNDPRAASVFDSPR